MKHTFVAYQRFAEAGKSQIFADEAGCHYLKPHPAITGEWTSPVAIHQAVIDNNNNPDLEPITGEIIILETFTY